MKTLELPQLLTFFPPELFLSAGGPLYISDQPNSPIFLEHYRFFLYLKTSIRPSTVLPYLHTVTVYREQNSLPGR